MSKLILNTKIGLEGRYRFVVRDARTHQITRETDWFKNLILNSGLDRLGGFSNSIFSTVVIGTGTTTPAVTDTQLATLSASTTDNLGSTTGNIGSPTYTSYRIIGFRFSPGSLNGNYSEVGIGWGSTSLFSRALIVDAFEAPTTITVLSTEYLDVYYELRMVPPITDSTENVTITGSGVHSVTRRALAVTSGVWVPPQLGLGLLTTSDVFAAWSGSLVAITDTNPSGYLGASAAATMASYVSASYERSSSAAFALGQGNGNIATITAQGAGTSFQFGFSPVIAKNNTQTLSLTGKISWARV